MQPSSFPETLKKLRGGAGVTQEDLAKLGTVSSSAICRWEKGQSTPKRRDDVERVDKALSANGELVRAWTSHTSGSALPPWMQVAARLMAEAVVIEYFSPSLVPGVLQCTEYAELVFRHGRPLDPPEEIQRLAAARSSRYEQLRRGHNPAIRAVFPQSALTLVPDGPRRAQAAHLCGMIDTGRVTICLVPEGQQLMSIVSPLLMVRLADGGRAATSDHVGGNALLEDHELELLDEVAKTMFATALPAHESRKVLGDMQ